MKKGRVEKYQKKRSLIQRTLDRHRKLDYELLEWAKQGNTSHVQEILRKNPLVNVAFEDSLGRTSLHFACSNGNYEMLDNLLKQPNLKTDELLDSRDVNKNTPLHLAVINGDLRIVQLLLEKGASVDAQNKFHHTPLDLIQSKIKLLLKPKPQPLELSIEQKYQEKIQQMQKCLEMCTKSKEQKEELESMFDQLKLTNNQEEELYKIVDKIKKFRI